MAANPTPEERREVGAHFAYLQDAVRKGQAVFVGRTTDDFPLGIAVFEAETLEAAKEFMIRDPAVVAGVMLAEIFPFRIALMRGRDDI